ncbi:MAG: hypothetical protein AAGA68_23595 [Pseudomonadota bacterium]
MSSTTEPPASVARDIRYTRVYRVRESFARDARVAQKQYLRLTRAFIVTTALAAITGGLLLYGLEAEEDPGRPVVSLLAAQGIQLSLVVLEALCLAVAGYCGYVLGELDPRSRWKTRRLKTEEYRLLLASRVLELGHAAGPEDFCSAGDWFLAFFEGQLGYLEDSKDRHHRTVSTLIIFSGLLAGLLALATALTGFDNSVVVVAVALLGVVAPAIASALRSWGEATASKRRAKFHEESWLQLMELSDRVPAFEAALAGHDLDGAQRFANQVFRVLRRDHEGFASMFEDGKLDELDSERADEE